MLISATYICPARGLAGLEPPEPVLLGRNARTANSPGLDRLLIPVLEESLIREIRSSRQENSVTDFIDIDQAAYLSDPHTHLPRLWDHFRESL